MSNRITDIEEKLKELLESIDGTIQPIGYTYHTKTGTVNIEDEVLSLANNTDNKMVNYCIYASDETGLDWSIGQNSYMSELVILISARVHNVGDEGNPKFAINERMNEVLSDFKHLLYKNNTIGRMVEIAKYTGSRRVYSATNNRITTGDIEIFINLQYSQQGENPDIMACNY